MASLLDMTRKKDALIDERLRTDPTIWLTSVRPDARPHAVLVWFLWDGESILIFSKPNNQKLRNLSQNSHVVLAVDGTRQGAEPITLEGTATLLGAGEANTALPAYVEKYGERIKNNGWTPETMAKEYSETIRIIPTRVV